MEVAGAMRDFLEAAGRQYDSVDIEEIEVILFESGERLLPEFPDTLGDYACHAMPCFGEPQSAGEAQYTDRPGQ